MNNKKKIWQRIAGKGYYIALVLCIAAIGITGYLYYRNTADDSLADPDGDSQQVLATQPSGSVSASEGSTATQPAKLRTGLPVSGETVMGHSMDALCYNATTRDWRVHNGMDITAEAGTPVCAAAEGVVYTTYTDDTMGTTVVLRHDGGYVTTYSSLDEELTVAVGDQVTLGQTIGYVGNTALLESAIGDHVHFCVSLNDEPLDPEEFLGLN